MTTSDAGLIRLIYMSKGQQITEQDLEDILNTATTRNPDNNITGILLFGEETFVQILEGPSTEVKIILAKIKRDPRHTDVKIVLEDNIKTRIFDGWAMAYAPLSDANIRNINGNSDIQTASDLINIIKDPNHYISDFISNLFLQLIEKNKRET